MRRILYFILCIQLLLLSACDVHEWPDRPEYTKLHIRLNYETDMTEWKHLYSGKTVIEQGLYRLSARRQLIYHAHVQVAIDGH